jgi:hypothetical protein
LRLGSYFGRRIAQNKPAMDGIFNVNGQRASPNEENPTEIGVDDQSVALWRRYLDGSLPLKR